MDSFSHLKALCHGEVYKELTTTEAYLDYNMDGTDVCTATIFDPCCHEEMYSVPLYSDVFGRKCFSTTCNDIQLLGGSIGSEEW